MSKKVVFLGPAHPLRGGIADFTERMAKAFQDNGDDVEIITFSLQYPSFLFPGKSQFSSSKKPKHLKINIWINSINPLNWIKTGRKIKKSAPDILIPVYWMPFMAPSLGTISRIVKKNKTTKVIATLHNIIPHEKMPGEKLLNKYFINNMDGFLALSKSVINDLSLFDKEKPRVYNPHPVYDNFGDKINKTEAIEDLGLDKKYKYLLFFGFIRDYKGLDILLEAMADERIKKSNIKLIVAGEYYSNKEKYTEIINNLDISDKLVLKTDFIPDEEVGKYFCAADIVVQPYKTATQSGVTQIAYNFEKPMIVTDVGGLAEIVPHKKVGFVCDINPKSIADSIIEFYSGNLHRFHENILVEKKKYMWETLLDKFNEIAED